MTKHVSSERRWLLVRAAVVGALAVGFTASVPSRADGPKPLPVRALPDPLTSSAGPAELVSAGLPPAQVATVMAQRALLGLGLPRRQVMAMAGPTSACSLVSAQPQSFFEPGVELLPLGDVNGDRQRDVIEAHEAYAAVRTTGVLSVRDARTGRAHWTVTRDLTWAGPNDVHALYGLPARVGRPSQPGVLMVRLDLRIATAGVVTTATLGFDLTGLDRRGRAVWHTGFSGSFTVVVTPSGVGAVTFKDFPDRMFSGRFRGPASDLVVRSLSTRATGGFSSEVRRFALDTGAVSHPYGGSIPGPLSPVTDLVTNADSLAVLGVAPDQDGDRLPDLYEVVGLTPASGVVSVGAADVALQQLRVLKGSTGDVIWQSPPVPAASLVSVVDAGAVTNAESRVHDLALVQLSPVSYSPPVAGQPTDRATGLVSLFKGGSGGLAWTLPGTGVLPMEKYRGEPGVGVTSVSAPSGGDGSRQSFDVDVYDGTGLAIDKQQHLIDVTTSCSWFLYRLWPRLDLTHDESLDGELEYTAFTDRSATERFLAIDGKSGRELNRLRDDFLSASVDGKGLTRVSSVVRPRDVTFVLRPGDKATATLGRVPVSRPHDDLVFLDGVLATRPRCADLSVAQLQHVGGKLRPYQHYRVSLYAANGKPWWSLTTSPTHPEGVVKRGKGARALC